MTGVLVLTVATRYMYTSHILYFGRWNGMERSTTSNYLCRVFSIGSPMALLISSAKSICKVVNTSREIPN